MAIKAMVTGLGVVTPIGVGPDDFWPALSQGVSGVDERQGFEVSGLKARKAAQVLGYDVNRFLASRKSFLDRNSELAFGAARQALDSARLQVSETNAERVGLSTGAAYGNLDTMRTFYGKVLEKGPKLAPPILAPHTFTNTTNSLLAIEYGIRGFNANFCSGMTAGLSAIAYAADAIALGRADAILAGGVESLSEPLFRGCAACGLLATDGEVEEDSRPFDRRRNGFILGEASGFVVLESAKSAGSRGVERHAAVIGIGMAAGIERAMRMALTDAGVSPQAVGAVFASANSSRDLDAAEARAILAVFGREPVPVCAVKSMLGESYGASSAVAFVSAVLALKHRLVPPTVNYEQGDADCELPGLSAEPQPLAKPVVLVNTIDPGGACVSVLLNSEL